MNPHFADWYRSAGIEPDSATLPKRWAAIEDTTLQKGELVDAALVFYGYSPKGQTFIQSLKSSLRKFDPAINLNGIEHELAVLAGAVLIYTTREVTNKYAYLSNLLTICPAAKNLRKTPTVRSIPEMASQLLSLWSVERSTNLSDEDHNADTHGREALHENCVKACTEEDFAGLSAALSQLLDTIKILQDNSSKLRNRVDILGEESNVLWWLMGAHSRDLKKPFTEFSIDMAALLAGRDLSNIVSSPPGPISSTAFLDKIIHQNRRKTPDIATIEKAINDMPDNLKTTILQTEAIEALGSLIPVHAALRASVMMPKGAKWNQIYTHATGIQPNAGLKACELGDQFYLECLLLRTWENCD